MKRRRMVIILFLCIFLAAGADILIFIFKNHKNSFHYSCVANTEESAQGTENYQLMTMYEFYFDNEGLTQPRIIQMFFFKNQEAYDSFNYKDFSDENPIETSEILTALEKNYTINKSIPADSNDLKSYLKKLKNMNYNCQIMK